jgi:hypothetical protein
MMDVVCGAGVVACGGMADGLVAGLLEDALVCWFGKGLTAARMCVGWTEG